MDSSFYPEGIRVGFFPLVFAVNAIQEENANEIMLRGNQTGDPPHQQQQQQQTLFELFLKAIAESLLDENDELPTVGGGGSGDKQRRTLSLFRPDEEENSSDEEDTRLLWKDHSRAVINRKKSGGFYAGFGRRTTTSESASAVNNNTSDVHHGSNSSTSTSYAKALTKGPQGFFQRARIVTISTKYGFPPSKDPEGTHNLAFALPSVLHKQQQRLPHPPSQQRTALMVEQERTLAALFHQYPVAGIIPSGWLEKHVHALPSTILVVCTVSARPREQAAQDRHLFETIEHLQYSLVPKRQCGIQVVGLMNDSVTDEQGAEWSQATTSDLVLEDNANTAFTVTMLRASTDLGTRNPFFTTPTNPIVATTTTTTTSEALCRLHRTVRDASLLYYLCQARRTKDKLYKLLATDNLHDKFPPRSRNHAGNDSSSSSGHPPSQLLPLVVRYCFKIAIFYEFQCKYEKSLRFTAEAYRSITKYYQWLLLSKQQQQHDRPKVTVDSSISAGDGGNDVDLIDEETTAKMPSTSSVSSTVETTTNTGDSVEVELTEGGPSDRTSGLEKQPLGVGGGGGGDLWSHVVPAPPEDMLYQCRAVADWLNLKLLASGLASHTEGGLLAAAHQWRLHSRVFCSTLRYSSSKLQQQQQNHHQQNIKEEEEDWFDWSYISRQRVVMSQLVERHPPKALGDLGNDFDEVVLRCSPWRSYESAAEAMLRLAREMDKARAHDKYAFREHQTEKSDAIRARYVGGLSTDGLRLDFVKECSVNHREKALELILHAISIFERELEKEKRGFYAEDEHSESSSSRTGARLYYLAGGILLGMGRHEESVGHLTKASRYSRGWRELELAVRRMLIECYEKHIPSQSEASESSETLVSMILDSYFNAEMSSQDLRRALDHFAAMSGGDDSLKWYHESHDEEDANLPFAFAVSFPGKTHATSGDTVEASVVIKSNLDYAIHVNAVALATLAGKLSIPALDLLSAVNASEGSDSGIIIQAKTAIIVSTKLELPKDLSAIAFDDSGNGGELQGVAGKGSFAKNAKPRTAGMTAAGTSVK